MWDWEQALVHVMLISDELECGSCRDMTPETVVRLWVETQRKRDLWGTAVRKDSFAMTLGNERQGVIVSRLSRAQPHLYTRVQPYQFLKH